MAPQLHQKPDSKQVPKKTPRPKAMSTQPQKTFLLHIKNTPCKFYAEGVIV